MDWFLIPIYDGISAYVPLLLNFDNLDSIRENTDATCTLTKKNSEQLITNQTFAVLTNMIINGVRDLTIEAV